MKLSFVERTPHTVNFMKNTNDVCLMKKRSREGIKTRVSRTGPSWAMAACLFTALTACSSDDVVGANGGGPNGGSAGASNGGAGATGGRSSTGGSGGSGASGGNGGNQKE